MLPETVSLDNPARRPAITAAVVALLGAVWLFVEYHDRRPFPDESMACAFAQELLRGGVFYSDIINEKPPLAFFLLVPFVAITGPGPAPLGAVGAMRLLAAALLGLTAWLAGRLAVRMGAEPKAWPLVTLTVVAVAPWFQAFNYLGEMFFAPLVLAAIEPMKRLNDRRALGWGALLGVALYLKQMFVAGVLALGALAPSWRMRALFVLGVGFGGASFLAGLCAWAGVEPVMLSLFINPAKGSGVYARGFYEFERGGAHVFFAMWSVGVVWAWRWQGVRLAVLLVALALPILPRMDLFRVWPAVPLLAALLVGGAYSERVPCRWRWAVAAPLVAVGMLGPLTHPPSAFLPWATLTGVAARVAPHIRSDDRIWAGPEFDELYCLTGAGSAAGHTFILPWLASESIQQSIIDDFAKHPPKVIVDGSEAYSRETPSLTAMSPLIAAYIAEHYAESSRGDGFVVYVRR